jgi:uncharacterized protein with HEPN domain
MKLIKFNSTKGQIDLGHVSLICGLNGSGKTRLLREINDLIYEAYIPENVSFDINSPTVGDFAWWINGISYFDFEKVERTSVSRSILKRNLNLDEVDEFKKAILEEVRSIYPFITEVSFVIEAGNDKSGFTISDDKYKLSLDDIPNSILSVINLIILLNYAKFSKHKITCLLVDNMGLGLDYEATKTITDLVINKSESMDFQLIMTTNDRVVMNKVHLKNWIVVDRDKDLFTYQNSKELFDDFEYSGLSNFNFLSSQFYDGGFEHEVI